MAISLDLLTQPYFGLGADPATRIPYTEKAEYTEKFGREIEIKRLCICRWSQRQDFIRAMCPDVRVGGAPLGMQRTKVINRLELDVNSATYTELQRYPIQRHHPEEHPRVPGVFCVEGEVVTGLGVPDNGDLLGSRYVRFMERNQVTGNPTDDGYAEVMLTYRFLPFLVNVDDTLTNVANNDPTLLRSELLRYVSRAPKPGSDSYQIAGNTMYEFDSGNVIPENIPRVFPKLHLAYTWHMAPVVPPTAYTMQGLASDHRLFDHAGISGILGNARLAGDALYLYPEIGPVYTIGIGRPVRDITYHFLYKQPTNIMLFRSSRLADPFGPAGPGFAGFVLPIRRGTAPTYDTDKPHKPGDTIYSYGRLESLFMAITPTVGTRPTLVY